MASSPITSWQILRAGQKVEALTDFIFLGSKITAGSNCSHEIKRHLLLGRKAMTNLDSILKSKDITLPTKVCIVRAMVFPVAIYEGERWTIKKAEHQELMLLIVVLEKTLESPLYRGEKNLPFKKIIMTCSSGQHNPDGESKLPALSWLFLNSILYTHLIKSP